MQADKRFVESDLPLIASQPSNVESRVFLSVLVLTQKVTQATPAEQTRRVRRPRREKMLAETNDRSAAWNDCINCEDYPAQGMQQGDTARSVGWVRRDEQGVCLQEWNSELFPGRRIGSWNSPMLCPGLT